MYLREVEGDAGVTLSATFLLVAFLLLLRSGLDRARLATRDNADNGAGFGL